MTDEYHPVRLNIPCHIDLVMKETDQIAWQIAVFNIHTPTYINLILNVLDAYSLVIQT